MPQLPKPPAFKGEPKSKPVIKPVKLPAGVSPLLQATRERAQAVWTQRKTSGLLTQFQLDQKFKEYLDSLMGVGPDAQAHAEKIIARAQEELEKRRHQVSALAEVLDVFRAPEPRMRFNREVMLPARSRRLSSLDVWGLVDDIMESKATKGPLWNLLRFTESKLGPVTIGLGPQAEVGAGLGFEAACGVSGLRHHRVAYFESQTIGVGTYSGATGSFGVGFSLGKPETGTSVSVGAAISAAYGASMEVSVSFKPVGVHAPRKPENRHLFKTGELDTEVVEYEFDGLGVSFGVGTPEIGITTGVTFTKQDCLVGSAK